MPIIIQLYLYIYAIRFYLMYNIALMIIFLRARFIKKYFKIVAFIILRKYCRHIYWYLIIKNGKKMKHIFVKRKVYYYHSQESREEFECIFCKMSILCSEWEIRNLPLELAECSKSRVPITAAEKQFDVCDCSFENYQELRFVI